MSRQKDDVLNLVNQSVKEAVRKARWKYSKPPLEILAVMIASPAIYFSFLGIRTFFIVMPDVLFISAVLVMFFGAWYDFGASTYKKELEQNFKKSLSEADATYINKQQLIMTLIYLAIGGLYMLCGLIIYLISLKIF
ncbi:MAG: hypothetical protein QXT48_04780 [Thermoplasmatales archaeon]